MSPSPSAVAVAAREAITVSVPSARRASAARAGRAPATVSSGGTGEQIGHPGGEHASGGGEPALGPPCHRAGDERNPDSGRQQTDRETTPASGSSQAVKPT